MLLFCFIFEYTYRICCEILSHILLKLPSEIIYQWCILTDSQYHRGADWKWRSPIKDLRFSVLNGFNRSFSRNSGNVMRTACGFPFSVRSFERLSFKRLKRHFSFRMLKSIWGFCNPYVDIWLHQRCSGARSNIFVLTRTESINNKFSRVYRSAFKVKTSLRIMHVPAQSIIEIRQ